MPMLIVRNCPYIHSQEEINYLLTFLNRMQFIIWPVKLLHVGCYRKWANDSYSFNKAIDRYRASRPETVLV